MLEVEALTFMPMAACDQVRHLSNAPAKAALVPKYVPGKNDDSQKAFTTRLIW